MIILGIILLVVGLLVDRLRILATIGAVVLVLGLILLLVGVAGAPLCGGVYGCY